MSPEHARPVQKAGSRKDLPLVRLKVTQDSGRCSMTSPSRESRTVRGRSLAWTPYIALHIYMPPSTCLFAQLVYPPLLPMHTSPSSHSLYHLTHAFSHSFLTLLPHFLLISPFYSFFTLLALCSYTFPPSIFTRVPSNSQYSVVSSHSPHTHPRILTTTITYKLLVDILPLLPVPLLYYHSCSPFEALPFRFSFPF